MSRTGSDSSNIPRLPHSPLRARVFRAVAYRRTCITCRLEQKCQITSGDKQIVLLQKAGFENFKDTFA
ncbi:hypothetical protein DPMN_174139, partial [Dreissena polymorpha]